MTHKKKDIDKLNKEYEACCNLYVQMFCDKQGFDEQDFDGWISGPGEIAEFITQYYFNISDIIYDLTTNQPKGFILEWQDYNTDLSLKDTEHKWINYYSYSKGFRL